jgi:hypothetical protein
MPFSGHIFCHIFSLNQDLKLAGNMLQKCNARQKNRKDAKPNNPLPAKKVHSKSPLVERALMRSKPYFT